MKGKIIKKEDKYFIEYKKDLFDGIFLYPDYSTEIIEIKNISNINVNDVVEFEITKNDIKIIKKQN
jgi:hypothetical protein